MYSIEHHDAHRATLKLTDTMGLIKIIEGQIAENIVVW